MAHIEGPKYPGPYVFDLTPLQAHLVDLAPNAMQGARGVQPNIDGVLEELATAIPQYANDLEIHPDIYPRVVAASAAIPEMMKQVAQMEKVWRSPRSRWRGSSTTGKKTSATLVPAPPTRVHGAKRTNCSSISNGQSNTAHRLPKRRPKRARRMREARPRTMEAGIPERRYGAMD